MPGTFEYQLDSGSVYIDIVDCDVTTLTATPGTNTNWTTETYAVFDSDDFTGGIQREGTDIIETGSAAGNSEYAAKDRGASGTIDCNANDVHFWFNYAKKVNDYIINGANGTRLILGSSATQTADRREYYLSGATTAGYFPILLNSWNAFHVSGSVSNVTTGSPTMTSIRHFTFQTENQNSNNNDQQPDFAMDWMRAGNKVEITAGTAAAPVTEEDLRIWDAGPDGGGVLPYYGLFNTSPGFFGTFAGLDVGDGTIATHVTFRNLFYFNDQFSADCTHNIRVEDNATLELGEKIVGNDDTYAVNGCFITSPDGYRNAATTRTPDIIVEGGVSFTNQFLCYDTKVFGWNDILFGQSGGEAGTIDLIGSSFTNNVNIEFRTALDAANCQFYSPYWTFIAANSTATDDAGVYTDNTTAFNNATAADVVLMPATEAVGDGYIYASSEKFSYLVVILSTAGVGGTIDWQFWSSDSGGSWKNFTLVDHEFLEINGDFLSTGTVCAWNADIDDWVKDTKNGFNGYWIRSRVATTYTTNPVGTQGFFGQRRIGSLFVAPNSLDNVQFFRCDRALNFQASATVTGYIATDNAYDIVGDDLLTITLINSTFDPDKILQI